MQCVLKSDTKVRSVYLNVHLWYSFAANWKASTKSRKASSNEAEGFFANSAGFVHT